MKGKPGVQPRDDGESAHRVGPNGVDRLLVERAQRGEKAAFDLLVLKYQHRLIHFVSRYVRDPQDAPDIAQDVFLRAYRSLPDFRGDSAFYTWLYRIAVNVAKNHFDARRRRLPHAGSVRSDAANAQVEPEAGHDESPERILLAEEIATTVTAAWETLPERLKTALSLREVSRLSYEDIAQATDSPIGTVRSRIFRAREHIARQLQPLFD